jgi:hypothetical protein
VVSQFDSSKCNAEIAKPLAPSFGEKRKVEKKKTSGNTLAIWFSRLFFFLDMEVCDCKLVIQFVVGL